MSLPQIADLTVVLIVLISQSIIARLYFLNWKKRLPPKVVPVISAALYCLWAITAFNLVLELTLLRLGRWVPGPIRGPLRAIGSTWSMGAAVSLAVYFLYRYFIRPGITKFSPEFSSDRRSLIRATGAVAMAAPFAAAAFGTVIERTRYRVNEIDLPLPNLHPDLEGLRIAQISDLHVSPYLSVREAGRVVDMTNELRPHLTVVTGDLITEAGDPLDDTILELARLRADAGVLGCLGNHEVYARCRIRETTLCARKGIKILRGEARQLRFGNGVLNVAGVDFQSFADKPAYLKGAEKLVVPGSANLLLSHNPDVFPVAVGKGYDAMLAGHTHGGQVTVEILNRTANFARFFTPYVAGLYRIDGRSCYVNAGIGTIAVPFRIGAPPEISLFRLRKA
jgi:predicted MPP superfamily phosphohydrolase